MGDTAIKLTLFELDQLGKALGEAANAIAKLGNSIAHMIKLGAQGWDNISARNAHARLIGMGAGIQQMRQSQGRMLDDLKEYIAAWELDTKGGRKPIPRMREFKIGWQGIRLQVVGLLTKVQDLLGQLNAERSDFVASDAYGELGMILSERVGLLNKLGLSPPPTSKSEIAKLREVQQNYQRLHDGLVSALALVNNYLRY